MLFENFLNLANPKNRPFIINIKINKSLEIFTNCRLGNNLGIEKFNISDNSYIPINGVNEIAR